MKALFGILIATTFLLASQSASAQKGKFLKELLKRKSDDAVAVFGHGGSASIKKLGKKGDKSVMIGKHRSGNIIYWVGDYHPANELSKGQILDGLLDGTIQF